MKADSTANQETLRFCLAPDANTAAKKNGPAETGPRGNQPAL